MTDDPTRPGSTTEKPAEGEWWPPVPETIRLMGEYTVRVPLWSSRGLLFADPESLIADLGVSRELARDLVAWADDWEARSAEPEHDAAAAALVRRLRDETERRYHFLYQP